MTVIGLTGGIASGKSTAAAYLASLGAQVIDADKLGHRAYEPGTAAFDQVVAAFGPGVVAADGTIDRKVLGSKVFGNEAALRQLTDIVWPAIRGMAETEIQRLQSRTPIIVFEAAVMLEAGWDDLVDELWVTIVDRDVAISRSMTRDVVDQSAVEARIDAQISNDERRARCDRVIDNSGSRQALTAQLDTLWRQLQSQSKAST